MKDNDRSIAAAVIVAFAAGPSVMVAAKIIQIFSSSNAAFWSRADLFGFAISPLMGLVGGAPAALMGVVAARILTPHGLDAVWLTIPVGMLIGAAVAAPLMIFGYKPDSAYYFMVFEMAAVSMSLLYWLIAIRPLRRQRLKTRDAA